MQDMRTSLIQETSTNIISEGTRIEGSVVFENVARVHGTLVGDVNALDDSTLILGETAVIEGNIRADVLIINGFVQGDVHAKTKVMISGTGRVIGNITAPTLLVEFGAYFEGKCNMTSMASPPGDSPDDGGKSRKPARRKSTAPKETPVPAAPATP